MNTRFFSYNYNQLTGNGQGTLNNQNLLTGDVNKIMRRSYNLLMHRCTTSYHENILIKTGINELDNKVIGSGLKLNAIPDFQRLGVSESRAKEISDEQEYLWNAFCTKCIP